MATRAEGGAARSPRRPRQRAEARPAEPTPAEGAGKVKEAVLVIHGIGEQDPYETVDAFARGLIRHFSSGGGAAPKIVPLLIRRQGWNEVAVRLDLSPGRTRRGAEILDCYEFYWAPYTEGKITYLQVLLWLRRAALTPLRYLAQAYHLFAEEGRAGRLAAVFFREIVRILFLSFPAIAATYLLAYIVTKYDKIVPVLGNLLAVWKGEPHKLATVAFVALTALALTLARALEELERELIRSRRAGDAATERAAGVRWRGYALIVFLLSAGLAALTIWYFGLDLLKYLVVVSRWHVWAGVVAAVVALWLRQVLVRWVGDIALYVNADEKAESYKVRSAILKDATTAIRRIVRSLEGYERVIIAGSSLGSVIAYDAVNRLLAEVRATGGDGPVGPPTGALTQQELEKVRGLVTFGSPLDKVYYFFRVEVPGDQAVRGQILSFLHAFRRARSDRSYGPFTFQTYKVPDPSPDFTWINVWAGADPISGYLDFYRPAGPDAAPPADAQLECAYPIWRWGYAHLMYWRDPAFYRYVADRVL